MFTLEQLEQLLAVERDQTLSRAARSLAVSQPTLTRSMQALERALGVPLFSRTKTKSSSTKPEKRRPRSRGMCSNNANSFKTSWPTRRFESDPWLPCRWNTCVTKSGKPIRAAPWKQRWRTATPCFADSRKVVSIKSFWTPGREPKRFSCKVFETETLFILVKQGHRFWNRQTIDFETLNGETMLLNTQIGSWESLVREKMPDSTFLMQTDLQALNVVRRHSSLPSFVSNFTPYTLASNERMIPLVDSEATKTFLLVTR